MKLIDKINNTGLYSTGKIISSSCYLIFLVMSVYFLIDFFTNDYKSQVQNPLSGKSYTILNDFNKNNVKFTEIDNILNKIFNYSNDININIIPSDYKGRYNPFSI